MHRQRYLLLWCRPFAISLTSYVCTVQILCPVHQIVIFPSKLLIWFHYNKCLNDPTSHQEGTAREKVQKLQSDQNPSDSSDVHVHKNCIKYFKLDPIKYHWLVSPSEALFNNVTLSPHTYSSSLLRCTSETFCFHLCRSTATCRHLHPGTFQRCSSKCSCPPHLRQAQPCSISVYSTVPSMSAQRGSNSFKSTWDLLWGEHLSGVSVITVNHAVS